MSAMSETATVQTKPAVPRGSASDTRVIAHVEKWMTVIREIKQDRAKS